MILRERWKGRSLVNEEKEIKRRYEIERNEMGGEEQEERYFATE